MDNNMGVLERIYGDNAEEKKKNEERTKILHRILVLMFGVSWDLTWKEGRIGRLSDDIERDLSIFYCWHRASETIGEQSFNKVWASAITDNVETPRVSGEVAVYWWSSNAKMGRGIDFDNGVSIAVVIGNSGDYVSVLASSRVNRISKQAQVVFLAIAALHRRTVSVWSGTIL